ncbi:MAG: GvpL/GvpF family gas vesicle protein [Acidobacteriota bacterium]|nr:GvpL/GvpF family gas vesicle protein [Acidobacteriota bacterium]
MSLYVYCLGDALGAGSFGDLRGVGGARVRVLGLGELVAVVSEFEGEAAEVSAENVRAHNRVNAAALALATPLPFRFGTVAREQRLAAYVSENEAALLDALARVRGCIEMSVKLRRAEKAEGRRQSAKEVGEEAEGERGAAPDGDAVAADEAVEGAAGVGRGTAFLLSKRREVLGDEALRRSAEEVAAWLASRVSELVRESSARVSPSEALFVRASHLVERARLEAYRSRVRELTAERADLHFLASGPWPPYSFSDIGRR